MDKRTIATHQSRTSAWLSPWVPLCFLCLVWAGKQFIGERWWLTTWLVYLPQALFLIPSVLMACVCFVLMRWRGAAGQIAAGAGGVALLFLGAYGLPAAAHRGATRAMPWIR